jgi:hypothetical protein
VVGRGFPAHPATFVGERELGSMSQLMRVNVGPPGFSADAPQHPLKPRDRDGTALAHEDKPRVGRLLPLKGFQRSCFIGQDRMRNPQGAAGSSIWIRTPYLRRSEV